MTKQATDHLKEARRIATAAGLFFTDRSGEYKLYRKTPVRPVYLGRRTSAESLCSLVKRCARSA